MSMLMVLYFGFILFISIDFVRSSLEKEKDFYILLYNVIDKYDYSNLIMDYALKLILNTSQNGKNFG
jgi:hypothetical protein